MITEAMKLPPLPDGYTNPGMAPVYSAAMMRLYAELAVREALAEQQEPVAYVWTNSKGWPTYGEKPHDYFGGKPLYSKPPQQEPLFKPLIDLHHGLSEELKALDAPAQRTWVGLTDEDILDVVYDTRVARAVEAKLKEKNT